MYSADFKPLHQLAAFFAPARVTGYRSMTALEHSAEKVRDTHTRERRPTPLARTAAPPFEGTSLYPYARSEAVSPMV